MKDEMNDVYTMKGWLALNDPVLHSAYPNGFELEHDGVYRVLAYGEGGELLEPPVATFNDDLANHYRRHGALLTARQIYNSFHTIRSVHQMKCDTERVHNIMQAYGITDEEVTEQLSNV